MSAEKSSNDESKITPEGEESQNPPEGEESKIPPEDDKVFFPEAKLTASPSKKELKKTPITKEQTETPSKTEQTPMRIRNFSDESGIADSPQKSKTRRARTSSRTKTFSNAKKVELEARVDLVEHALGKFVFSHTGMSLDDAFAYFDKDSSSALEKSEIKYILNQTKAEFSEEELQLLMDRYDEDRSGGITIQEFERNYRVKREELLKYVKNKEACRVDFAELPIIFIFFICFVLLLAGHDLTSTKYTASAGILAGALNPGGGGKPLSSLKSPDRIWNWLEKEFMEYAFVQEDLSGNPLPKEDWGYISNYNKFLGPGVHLSQVRSVSEECRISEINDAYGDKCFPTHKLSSKKFGSVYDNFTAFNPISGSSHTSHKQFTALLDYKLPQAELKRTIQTLKKNNWIDKSTAWLDVKYVVMNMESYGTYTTVTLEFEFSRGGRVIPSYNAVSVLVNPYVGYNIGWAVLDLIWIAFQIYTAVTEGKDLCESGWKKYSQGVAGVWNVIDWIQIVVTLTVAGLWFTMVGYLFNLLTEADNGANPVDFVDTIELIVRYTVAYKLLSVVNLVLLVLRFFKGFAAQPRLRVLVDAIVGAAVDLAHWFIIFISLLLTFVMCAMFLFGHQIEIFSDVPKGLFYASRGWIVANAIPYLGFFETDPTFTIMWFLLFCFIMLFVVQKMVLAIVLMSFVKTRNANKDARTLWSQISDFCTDMTARTRNLMRLADVISLIEEPQLTTTNEDRINLNMLLKSYRQFNELTPKQDKYSQKFCLRLMQEFFDNDDKIRAPDMYVRSTNAYARTTQLDEDFDDLNERLDSIEAAADEALEAIRATFGSGKKSSGKKSSGKKSSPKRRNTNTPTPAPSSETASSETASSETASSEITSSEITSLKPTSSETTS